MNEQEQEYIGYFASRTEPQIWYTPEDQTTIKQTPISSGWRILLMILFPPYAIYRSWRGINQANELLTKKQQIIQEKQKHGLQITENEKQIINTSPTGIAGKLLAFLPIYNIYSGAIGIGQENELLELKKDEILKKYKPMYTRVRVKASQITPDFVVECSTNKSPEEIARIDAKINAEKQRWTEEQKTLAKTTSNVNSAQPQRSLMTTSRQNNLCKEN